jgi:tetratricopeptide (TPR) repeat protein
MSSKKKMIYAAFVLLFLGFSAFALIHAGNKEKESILTPLKERKGAMANSQEWLKTKATVDGLIKQLERDPKDTKSKLLLAQSYIMEGRVTGDHAYYDPAALKVLDNVLAKEPEHFEALCFKATVLLSQHHFAEGLELATKASRLYDGNAYVFGLITDANVELGHYDEAVKNCDKMISLRPDLTSYSRASYLREIYGDNKGAIEAMKMAVTAGFPGLEQSAWCRVQLGKLYENIGDTAAANLQYHITLSQRPDYVYAIAGLGRLERIKKNYAKSIEYYSKAAGLVDDYTFQEDLCDIYRLSGQNDKATEAANKAISMLTPTGDATKPGHGHYTDRELAYSYLKINDYDKALTHALIEYNRRPDNIDVNETMAWVKYKKGEYKEAVDYIKVAMKTNCQTPTLLCRAGLIKIKSGDKDGGEALVKKAKSLNPYLPSELTDEAGSTVAVK